MPNFPDDEWRHILETNGFTPSGAKEEVWRSPNSDIKVKIDVDEETEEPYYQIVTDDGLSMQWSDSEILKKMIAPKEQEPPKLSPEEEKEGDDAFLKSMGIRLGTVRTETKRAGRPPRFSFAVPMKAAGQVAFYLAKAGMKDFDVVHYKEDDFSQFTFPNEPEMHVAEEIIKAKFADQIAARKGYWGAWAEFKDPTQVRGERELDQRQYVASLARAMGKFAGQWGERSYDSDQVHDILDKHRNKDSERPSFDSPVSNAELPALLKELDAVSGDGDIYLGVIVFLVTHGSNVPTTYRERARQIAFAEVQDEAYLQEWADPKDRRVELENEIELLEGNGKVAADATERYRRKKLLAWIEMLGLDLSDELRRYDGGDFWEKDKVYEEVREMVKEERKFQNHYRRKV